MRVPEALEPLVDHGVIQEVVRPLLSGKEAQIYLVIAEGEHRVAKVYKDAKARTFRQRAQYAEGRQVRNSRDQRAMSRGSRYGRARDETAWRRAEVDAIYRLRAAGVRVPKPHAFVEGVLVMELVTDAAGEPAPRLADVTLDRGRAQVVFDELLREVVKMLCAGVVHGDLSGFNVLMAAAGPTIIDFPQCVDPVRNQNARKLLLRDVANLTDFLARTTRTHRPPYGQEIWDLYERNLLAPGTELTGRYEPPRSEPVAAMSLLAEIEALERTSRERRVALGLPAVRPARQPRAGHGTTAAKAAPARQPRAGEKSGEANASTTRSRWHRRRPRRR